MVVDDEAVVSVADGASPSEGLLVLSSVTALGDGFSEEATEDVDDAVVVVVVTVVSSLLVVCSVSGVVSSGFFVVLEEGSSFLGSGVGGALDVVPSGVSAGGFCVPSVGFGGGIVVSDTGGLQQRTVVIPTVTLKRICSLISCIQT